MIFPKRIDVILDKVRRERERQDELCKAGKFKWTCATEWIDHEYARASPRAQSMKLAVLAEEFGEVSHEICDGLSGDINGGFSDARIARLKDELIQVAAVCVAWAESL